MAGCRLLRFIINEFGMVYKYYPHAKTFGYRSDPRKGLTVFKDHKQTTKSLLLGNDAYPNMQN